MRRLVSVLSVSLSLAVASPLLAQSPNVATAPSMTNAPAITSAALAPSGVALRHHVNAPTPDRDLPAPEAGGFASSGFAQFMSSPAGRILRVAAGAGMVAGGTAADTDFGTGIAIAGALPILAGAFDFCVISPLFGGPISGKEIRAARK